jgi:hypothetical protein
VTLKGRKGVVDDVTAWEWQPKPEKGGIMQLVSEEATT